MLHGQSSARFDVYAGPSPTRFQLHADQAAFVDSLLALMALEEKVGQLVMRMPGNDGRDPDFRQRIRSGQIGAVLNVVDPDAIEAMQAIAVDAAPHGIPLLFARDVIHGFRTIFPLPIGQAATFDPAMVEQGSRYAAREAASVGLRWNFAPMIDVTRDPRWGRVAESFGEDPVLTARLGQAAIRGYQFHGDSILMAACAKHFAAYGAPEGGRDYNSTNVSEDGLRNIYLPSFMAAVEAGAMTFMPSFADINGVPASGNSYLFRDILRGEWGFEGAVVSDWASIDQMMDHGVAADAGHAAQLAIAAGIDQDMMSQAYPEKLLGLVQRGQVPVELIDQAVRRILSIKVALNLFDHPFGRSEQALLSPEGLAMARKMVHRSTVLLQNRDRVLPLDASSVDKVAVIGPLADDGYEQLGTWVFDGKPEDSRTPLQSLRSTLGEDRVLYVKGLTHSRDLSQSAFGEALDAVSKSDVALLFLGEEAILHGEAHSRASIRLPGAQEALLKAIAASGKPVVVVVMAGRPLVLDEVLDAADAWLYAWAPGTMGGPGLTDVLFGDASPSGHLPITFPKHEGQIPIYHAQRNTGRPANADSWTKLEEIPQRAFQTSIGNTSLYLDAGFEPRFPFGHGLTYTDFKLESIGLDLDSFVLPARSMQDIDPIEGQRRLTDSMALSIRVSNAGDRDGETVLQIYASDPVSSIARPVRQLIDFQRIAIPRGKDLKTTIKIPLEALHYWYPDGPVLEAGMYRIWVGFDAQATQFVELYVVQP